MSDLETHESLKKIVELTGYAVIGAINAFATNPSKFTQTGYFRSKSATDGTPENVLEKELFKSKIFSRLINSYISSINSTTMIHDFQIGPTLLEYAMEHGASKAVEDLVKFTQSPESHIIIYTVLSGVNILNDIEINDSIKIVSWKNIPENQRNRFRVKNNNIESIGLHLQHAEQTAVLISTLPKRRVLFPSDVEAAEAVDKEMTEIKTVWENAYDIARCAALITNKPAAALGSWAEFSNQYAERFNSVSYSLADAFFDPSLFEASSTQVISSEILALFTNLRLHSPTKQAVLRLTIDRFCQSLRRPNFVDKAIDLGISLEAMVLSQLKNDKAELSFRIAVYGSTYLATTPERRREIFKLIRDIYDLRSKAVHQGTLESNAKNHDTLTEGTKIVSEIAKKIIHEKNFPDWETIMFQNEKST